MRGLGECWNNVKGNLCVLVANLCFMSVCICPVSMVSLWPGVYHISCLCVCVCVPAMDPLWWADVMDDAWKL